MARPARAIAAAIAGALLVASCSDESGPDDPLQITDNPVAATPAESPETTEKPAGTVIDVGGDVTAVAFEPRSRTIAAAVDENGGSVIAFHDADTLRPDRRLGVPGRVERLTDDGQGSVVGSVPEKNRLVHVTPGDSGVSASGLDGGPTSVADLGDATLVALREKAAVQVIRDEKPAGTIAGEIASADQVVVAGGKAAVLDRVRSALFLVDVEEGEIGLGIRAGQGATNAVADRFGRVLTVDTRSGALLAFSLDPFVLRQRFPVPGDPYAIAYDAERDVAWITLTGRNEVVGFDVAGGEPIKMATFPTVRQPNSVTVDEQTGSVVVASAAGEGIQVIEP